MQQRLRVVLVAGLIMLGSWMGVGFAQDVMAEFGLKAGELETKIVDALAKGYVPAYPNRKMFKSASAAAQVSLVQNSLAWLKAYTETEAFKADYRKQREAAKPAAPKAGGADEKYAAHLAEQRQGIEKMKQEAAQMPPDVQKQMQAVIKQLEADIDNAAKDQRMAAMVKEGYKQEGVAEQQSYQERLAAWEKQYPADPRALVAARLRQFMEVSGSIAFDAPLTPAASGKTMKFSDPQYEAKPREWKLCYRAGREPVQAARVFVGAWLSQLDKQ
ncbi:MAG: hypothetical protein ACOY3Z_01940 [Thermodesulfobacteriota bacterium]